MKKIKNKDYLTLANERYSDNKELKQQDIELKTKQIDVEYAKINQKEKAEKHKHTRAIVSSVIGIATFLIILIIIICVASRKI